MNPKKLATHYLRFFGPVPGGKPEIADNAPTEFWKFALTLPPKITRGVLYEALKSVALGDQINVPDTTALLHWLAATPEVVERADALLGGKSPPKNLSTLLRNTYLADVQAARVLVLTFLNGEIAKFTM